MAGKERGMLLKAIDNLIVSRMNPADYPTAGKVFLSSMQGVRTPITEKHFTPEELGAMQSLIDRKGGLSGAIKYNDYENLVGRQEIQTAGYGAMTNSLGNVRNTLGQFRYKYDPTTRQFHIHDTYDFNDPQNGVDMESKEVSYLADPRYSAARWYAGQMMPPGEGRDVNIGLPPTRFRETTRDVLKRLVAEEAQASVRKRTR